MLILGMILGFGAAMLLCAYAIEEIENEAYTEGYNDGLKAGDKDGRCEVDQDNHGCVR